MALLTPDKKFLEYEKKMISDPAYAGMPDLYWSDGRIQWEAPSNRSGGEFRFSHDKRMSWWRKKAAEIGVSTAEKQWISKVAKQIHPTKQKPCKVCGRIMDIRYCYLNAQFIRAVNKLDYVNDELEMDECTNILDFVVEFESLYGERVLKDLNDIFKCKAVSVVPDFTSVEECLTWLKDVYIPSEPSRLSPGAMSNAPDRFDGFHTYNRCCRSKADKGRSKQNLASYSTDRRAFEYWVDGNWVEANKTMGLFKTDPTVKAISCMNDTGDGSHAKPCDADHIGPISLGFMHRPVFQTLCSSCNSAKNNRMYLSDVKKLIAAETNGEPVASWYAQPVWDKCKTKVSSSTDALKLSMIMRDNRHNAMKLLGLLLDKGCYVFLTTLLNLGYADYKYTVDKVEIDSEHTVRVGFKKEPSTLEYSSIQKSRRLRVAFVALATYGEKGNRNGYTVNFKRRDKLLEEIVGEAQAFERKYPTLHDQLEQQVMTQFQDAEVLRDLIKMLPNPSQALKLPYYQSARGKMDSFMEGVAVGLAGMWDDPRYTRDAFDD